ncbi:MAG: efflux RND transporter periplasmic adaptor subunit [Granulosicoccaceae bacterium]|jgi:cobalt-zinc-cadmium efflux system membrane fusion protein
MLKDETTRRQWRRAGGIVALTALVGAVLIWTTPDRAPQLKAVSAVKVAAHTLAPANLNPVVEVTGRLQPVNRALMRFELSGQLAERLVEPGQAVAKGELLLRLADGDYRDALNEARAQLTMQRAAVKRDRTLLEIARRDRELQRREVARLEKLGSASLVSVSHLDQARQRLLALESSEAELAYKVDTAQAQILISESNVARAQRNLERASLTAPFAGTVNTVELEQGDYVSPNQPALELIDTRHIVLYVEVNGQVAAALSLGQQVSAAVDGVRLPGEITALQNDPDPETFTHALRIRVDGQDLQTGQLATARLPLRPLTAVLAVPISAVLREEGRNYVFVIRQGKLSRREIVTGMRHEDQVVVRQGLEAGEQVVARDVAALTDSQSVEVGDRVR